MKHIGTKSLSLILSFLGACLFYKQYLGLNVLLFTLLSVTTLVIINRKIGLWKMIPSIFPALMPAAMLMLYPQAVTFLIWMLGYLLMWSSHVSGSQPITILTNSICSLWDIHINERKKRILRKNTPRHKQSRNRSGYWITGGIILIFTLLYGISNPVISSLLFRLDLTFIRPGFILLIAFLFIILYGMVAFKRNEQVSKMDNYSQKLQKGQLSPRVFQEFKIAKISIWSVAVLSTTVNLIDLIVILTGSLPADVTYKEYVHQGFFTLILTLCLALGLIIYFFRGQTNFHNKIEQLKKAAYFWIAQNLAMAIITGYKNMMYVEAYGLTYKRIAVFLFLLCLIIGLALSFQKIKSPLNNWFYFNKLTLYAYFTFILISFIPYDHIITHYNLNCIQAPDTQYILSLKHPDLHALEAYRHYSAERQKEHEKTLNTKIRRIARKADQGKWPGWNLYLNNYLDADYEELP